jgi:hypothetical protein
MRIWVASAMWIMWFIRRFSARDSRCRTVSPEDVSMGAVPVQEANRLRSAKRVTSPTSARMWASTIGHLLAMIDDLDRGRQLVGIDPDDDLLVEVPRWSGQC